MDSCVEARHQEREGGVMGRKLTLGGLSAMMASLFSGMQNEPRPEQVDGPSKPTTPTVQSYTQRYQRKQARTLSQRRWYMAKASRKKNYLRNGTRG